MVMQYADGSIISGKSKQNIQFMPKLSERLWISHIWRCVYIGEKLISIFMQFSFSASKFVFRICHEMPQIDWPTYLNGVCIVEVIRFVSKTRNCRKSFSPLSRWGCPRIFLSLSTESGRKKFFVDGIINHNGMHI